MEWTTSAVLYLRYLQAGKVISVLLICFDRRCWITTNHADHPPIHSVNLRTPESSHQRLKLSFTTTSLAQTIWGS